MVSGTVDRVEPLWAVQPNSLWAIDALILDPENARKHSQENIQAIKASLARFGQQKPIVVTETGLVKAGNGTVIAAQELNWTQLWCTVTQLSDEEADKYAIADNRTAELAVWDDEVLFDKLKSWPEGDSELFDALGFNPEDILEPDLADLDVDIDNLGISDQDFLQEALIVLQVQIPQSNDNLIPAQQEIQAICDKHGFILESRVQLR